VEGEGEERTRRRRSEEELESTSPSISNILQLLASGSNLLDINGKALGHHHNLFIPIVVVGRKGTFLEDQGARGGGGLLGVGRREEGRVGGLGPLPVQCHRDV
jgi:hypothetical protein